MKRREFLKLLGAAPVALPMAAKAAASGLADGGVASLVPGVFGETVWEIAPPPGGFLVTEEFSSDLFAKVAALRRQPDELLSVREQMADDDIFEESAA